MYDSTFTFKTRRRDHLLLLCLLVIAQGVVSVPTPIHCPTPCECYLNSNGIPSARCSEITSGQEAFPNIHVLVLRASDGQNECHIPENMAQILPQLNFLYMTNCSLTSISRDVFKDLKSLEEVDLSNNYIKKLDSNMFVHNEKLQYVNLQNNPLHISDKPLLISKCISEIDLTSCGIRTIPPNMFKNLTHLRYLTLYNNKLRTIEKDTLPSSLRTVNLGKNHIRNVPTEELLRLKKIREIDLSENPVHCTCALIGFQNWVSGKGVTFANGIECASPREYAGHRLIDLPQYELCDAVARSRTECGDNEICTNQIAPEEETTMKKNYIMDDFERDEVVPVDKKGVVDYINEMQSDSADDGSGDGTDIPELISDYEKEKSKSTEPPTNTKDNETETKANESEQTSPSTETKPSEASEQTNAPEIKPSEASESTSLSTGTPTEATKSEEPSPLPDEGVTEKHNDVTMYQAEISTVKSSESTKEDSSTPVAVSAVHPSSKSNTESASEHNKETETVDPTEKHDTTPENKTQYVQIQEVGRLQSNDSQSDSSIFNLGYIIPCLAILVVIIICLGVYLGQRSSHKKNWDPKETNTNDGTELQDVSLIPDKSKTPIVKNTKYPSEGNSEQTERLMDSPSVTNSVWEHLEEPIENGKSKHVDGNTLPNGQSNDKNEPIECAIAKVTTLPDSIPRTPVIRNT